MPFNIIQKQIFEIMRVAATRKANLELKLMRKKLGARILATITTSRYYHLNFKKTGIKKNKILDKIFFKVENTHHYSTGFFPR